MADNQQEKVESAIRRAFPDDWKYVWFDEDETAISPRHDSFAKAIRWAFAWKPRAQDWNALPKYANGSEKPPVRLVKIHIVHEVDELNEKQLITIESVLEAFKENDS
jgi:hypothetical protein